MTDPDYSSSSVIGEGPLDSPRQTYHSTLNGNRHTMNNSFTSTGQPESEPSISPHPDSHHVKYPSAEDDKAIINDSNGSYKEPTKKLRFASFKRKNSDRKVSDRLRAFSQHVPVLSTIVDKPIIQRIEGGHRTIYVNEPLEEEDIDPETGGPKVTYARNKIRTTKYTPLNFIPKNLYLQFHNIANIYFLFIVILGAFPIFGVVSPGLSAVPIIVIVIITAIKDAIEDYRRMLLDLDVNNTVTHVLDNFENPNFISTGISSWRKFKKASTRFFVRGVRSFLRQFKKKKDDEKEKTTGNELDTVLTQSTYYSNRDNTSLYSERIAESSSQVGSLELTRNPTTRSDYANDNGTVIDKSREFNTTSKFKRQYWKNVNVGDIVKIYNDDEIPADIVVLSSSDEDGACYIETRNLDGETNLKIRQAMRASQKIKHSRDCQRSVFKVVSEDPHADLYSYNGVLKWEQRIDPNDPLSSFEERSEAVTINNLLLRGCCLRNTKWVIGLVVYTGMDTKIMLNAGETPSKRSRVIRELNINVVINFVFLFILSFVSAVLEGSYWNKTKTSAQVFEFGSTGGSPAVDGLITFWAAVILLQNLIPISLYITIEIIKTLQAFFIYNDVSIYYDKIDYPCTPKSWSISDDLGQIEYIFSDKTGTLTQNVMEFKKCSINGVSYGLACTEAMLGMMKRQGRDIGAFSRKAMAEIQQDRIKMVSSLRHMYDNPQLFEEDMTFTSSKAVDDLQGASGEEQSAAVFHFFLALAICHSVLPDQDEHGSNKLQFKAQSPDESALVSVAKDMGFTLMERTRDGIIIDVAGDHRQYQILTTLEFNSTRKRMSVIVKMPESGKIFLICKGADSVIFSRLTPGEQPELRQSTLQHLEEFASEGLRTLCLAQREISKEEYKAWSEKHDIASRALQNRDEQMEMVADEIERGLTLIGGTSIEDRLQDGVPESIAHLAEAGIKLWVLTGDKVETAINIGFSCNLLDSGMELIVIQVKEDTVEAADALLTDLLSRYFNMVSDKETLLRARKDHSPPSPKYAIVIDGEALALVLDDAVKTKFVLLCKQCKSVLCCRVSPSQKAAVVSVVKNTLDVMTLSIGDGANDVAMIQEADVGIGIAGVEGRQAVMSSDYAIGQFRFLNRLMLVHGRWAYRRLAEMTANLFYKNVVFTLTLFWYGVNNSFDESYLFDYTYITLFNLAFTSLPVIFMGFLDQDVSDKVSLAVPELYMRGILRKEWTQKKFW